MHPKEGGSDDNAKVVSKAYGQGKNYLSRQQNVVYVLKLTPRPCYQHKGQEHCLLDTNSITHIKDFDKQLLEMCLSAQGFEACVPYLPILKVGKAMREIRSLRNSFNKTSVAKPKPPSRTDQQQPTAIRLL